MKSLLKKLKTFAVAGIAMGLAITPVFAGSIPTGLKVARNSSKDAPAVMKMLKAASITNTLDTATPAN